MSAPVTSAPAGDHPQVLVLGVGNELLSDEGLGVVAARRLADLNLPGVEVLDGATLGLALLPEIADREALLVLDAAVRAGTAPGDVIELSAEEIPLAWSVVMSAHQIGVTDALAAAELSGRAPGRVAAVGMVPASLDSGYGLTPLVEARLQTMISCALDVLGRWGVPVPEAEATADA